MAGLGLGHAHGDQRSLARRRLDHQAVLVPVNLPEPGMFEAWRKGLLKELRAQSFQAFPDNM